MSLLDFDDRSKNFSLLSDDSKLEEEFQKNFIEIEQEELAYRPIEVNLPMPPDIILN